MQSEVEGGRRRDVVRLVRHELNTPLATALLYLGIAEGSAATLGSGVVRSAVRVARMEIERLRSLLTTVTELEGAGRATVRPGMSDIDLAVRAAVERVAIAHQDANVRVVASGDLIGWWDRSLVEQIVGNLLSNALKFGLGRPIRVEVKAAEHGATIAVRDHGIGIAAAEQDLVFQRDVHAPADRGGGLGLGLWLVRELAATHGGWVTLESRPGRGSTFTVFLREQAPLGRRGGMAIASARPPLAIRGGRHWQERALRSHRKVPLLARRVTLVPIGSTMMSPSLTASRNPRTPSKTRKSIDVVAF
jgi:signal transduction histidine kinase